MRILDVQHIRRISERLLRVVHDFRCRISPPVISLHRNHVTLPPVFFVLKRHHTLKTDALPYIHYRFQVNTGGQVGVFISSAVRCCRSRLTVAHFSVIGIPLAVRILGREKRRFVTVKRIVKTRRRRRSVRPDHTGRRFQLEPVGQLDAIVQTEVDLFLSVVCRGKITLVVGIQGRNTIVALVG